jgi:hypothetical protein
MKAEEEMVATAYLADIGIQFEKLKSQAERAIAQVSDEQVHAALDPESNSLAIIMRHMAGNLRSRFTDFLTTDGEKPDRNRDGEFELQRPLTRAEVMADWESGWAALFSALPVLEPGDLLRDVYIRGERHSVLQALQRQLTHHAGHVGQIVFMAKYLAGPGWQTLSIPKRIPDR